MSAWIVVAALAGGALAAACRAQAAACAEPPADAAAVSAAAPLRLAWRAEPSPIRVGQSFELTVWVCPAEARLTRVDATMPEHRHGMNYRPSVVPAGAGRWQVQGLLWHMPGRWEWRFEVEPAPGAARLSLVQPVLLR